MHSAQQNNCTQAQLNTNITELFMGLINQYQCKQHSALVKRPAACLVASGTPHCTLGTMHLALVQPWAL